MWIMDQSGLWLHNTDLERYIYVRLCEGGTANIVGCNGVIALYKNLERAEEVLEQIFTHLASGKKVYKMPKE